MRRGILSRCLEATILTIQVVYIKGWPISKTRGVMRSRELVVNLDQGDMVVDFMMWMLIHWPSASLFKVHCFVIFAEGY